MVPTPYLLCYVVHIISMISSNKPGIISSKIPEWCHYPVVTGGDTEAQSC